MAKAASPVSKGGIKFVLVGDGAVGKTSMLVSYIEGRFPKEYIPTVFDNHEATKTIDGEEVQLNLWDSAGQEEYDSIRILSYPDTSVFLVVFSVDSKQSFDNLSKKWFKELKQHEPSAPIIVIGAKKDLRDDPAAVAQLVEKGKPMLSAAEYERLALEQGAAQYLECSAVTREGLEAVFVTAVRLAKKSGRDGSKSKPLTRTTGSRKSVTSTGGKSTKGSGGCTVC